MRSSGLGALVEFERQETATQISACRSLELSCCLAEWSERLAELSTKKFRLFPRREMPAPIDFVEVGQVLVGAPGPCLWRPVDVLRKHRDGYWQGNLGSLLRSGKNDAAS